MTTKRTEDKVIYALVKRGKPKVVRIVREQYLRKDIEQLECEKFIRLGTEREAGALYFVLDYSVTCDYFELFETPELQNIIILQSVALEVKEHSFAFYNRLRKKTNDIRHNSFVFSNENFEPTSVVKPYRSKRERLELATMQAFAYLQGRLPCVLLTQSEAVMERCTKLGYNAMDVLSYLKLYYGTNATLLDLYSSLESMLQDRATKETRPGLDKDAVNGYRKYYSDEILDAGVKSGNFYRGKLVVNAHRPSEAYVKLADKAPLAKVWLPSLSERNRAVHGDIVIVEPESTSRDGRGRVVGLVQTRWRPYVCTVQLEESVTMGQMLLAIPWDSRIPKIRFRTKQAQALLNKRFVVRIDEWPVDSFYPNGHYVRQIGDIGNRDAELETLMVEHEIVSIPFTPPMLADLPQHTPTQPWRPDPAEIARRRDIRTWRTMSIDPLGCEDIDDALSVEALPDNKLRVGVHIADVSHFVVQGTPLDMEAQARATSVYFVDRRIDMLPAVLSATVCSLREKVDRYAVSAICDFDRTTGEVSNMWFGRTVIRSIHELNYELAQQILNDDKSTCTFDDTEYRNVQRDLKMLFEIYVLLRDKRKRDGALDLESFEVKFMLDEKKNPIKVKTKTHLDVMNLVAEFMIFANVKVAEKIAQSLPCALLRHHVAPPKENYNDLLRIAQGQGWSVNTTSNLTIQRFLDRVMSKDALKGKLLKSQTTLAMAEAQYFATSTCEIDQYRHYGLAVDYYTHFTSPIRRYADVIVHRQLLEAVGAPNQSGPTSYLARVKPSSKFSYGHEELDALASHINDCNLASKNVQRQCNELYHGLYFRGHTGVDEAVISDVAPDAISVFVPKYNLKSKIYLKDKDNHLLLPPDVCRLSGSVVVTDCSVNETKTALILATSLGALAVNIFDPVVVKITANESRAHMTKARVELLHFGKNLQERSNSHTHSLDADRDSLSTDPAINSRKEESKSSLYKLMGHHAKATLSVRSTCGYPQPQAAETRKLAESKPISADRLPKKSSKPLVVGRRTFRETEYQKVISVRYDEYGEEEEAYASPIAHAAPRYHEQISEAENKVKTKIIRKVHIIKKQKHKGQG